ncbi:hypothetical protein CSB45_15065 [candidate division KSB3 bacterium]|uniref:HEAT repeat domain-containing protein n=1 Tax=candidate division KSB3 bacterium TaxID=2044937 RepID=A0A2G6E145_9BACT|nr:MAG: hypothetical protein CSB45_15065 [candidate division KSB3 bacterium]
MEITIPITNWKSAILVVGLVVLAFCTHHVIYYYNPKLDETITALQSDDPAAIAQALLESSDLDMAKGHKLIPYILPLLSDKRLVTEHAAQEMTHKIQSSPGAIPGMGAHLNGIPTVGFSAAMTIQALVIVDTFHTRWIGGKAKERIISYVTQEIDPDDEYSISNALAAVGHIHSRRLLPFWFQCLAIESESIRIQALSGLTYYIYDRTHGLFTWKPEKEISQSMAGTLKACLEDPSPYIRQEAEDVIRQLKTAGFSLRDE